MSYYKELGVPQNASDEEIRAAYRRKAKGAHPDKGGDAAKMTQVNRAYETLISPQRRLTYDRTGQDRPPQTDNAAQQFVMGIVMEWLQSETNSGDLIRDCTLRLDNETRQVNGQIETGTKIMQRLTTRLKKLKYRGEGPNFMRVVALEKIGAVSHEVERLKDKAAMFGKAREVLKTYEYEAEIPSYVLSQKVIFNR